MAEQKPPSSLQELQPSSSHEFSIPTKRIHEGKDVDFWFTTYAYTDIMTFLLHLNAAMFPRKSETSSRFQTWHLGDQNLHLSDAVKNLKSLMEKLEKIIEEAPPDPGPRRFGNVSFRKWYRIVEQRADDLLVQHLPSPVLRFGASNESEAAEGFISAKNELKTYLLGSFGSAQRLDYGTGHELSLIAFLGCIWKLGGFKDEQHSWGTEERGIVLGVVEPYGYILLTLNFKL